MIEHEANAQLFANWLNGEPPQPEQIEEAAPAPLYPTVRDGGEVRFLTRYTAREQFNDFFGCMFNYNPFESHVMY